jgi:hypothetical protein
MSFYYKPVQDGKLSYFCKKNFKLESSFVTEGMLSVLKTVM